MMEQEQEWFPMCHDGGSSLGSIAEECEQGYSRPQALRRVERHCKSAELRTLIHRALRPRIKVRMAKIGI